MNEEAHLNSIMLMVHRFKSTSESTSKITEHIIGSLIQWSSNIDFLEGMMPRLIKRDKSDMIRIIKDYSNTNKMTFDLAIEVKRLSKIVDIQSTENLRLSKLVTTYRRWEWSTYVNWKKV